MCSDDNHEEITGGGGGGLVLRAPKPSPPPTLCVRVRVCLCVRVCARGRYTDNVHGSPYPNRRYSPTNGVDDQPTLVNFLPRPTFGLLLFFFSFVFSHFSPRPYATCRYVAVVSVPAVVYAINFNYTAHTITSAI